MDPELLIALVVLWLSTTGALATFLPMWLGYEGESFHPHSVDVDQRHSLYLVVSSQTVCKLDCCVASISAFVAPRGSSSSKNFTVLVIAIAISGFLGSVRWAAVGDAGDLELRLSLLGFSSLIFVSVFELDVSPKRFLEDKLRVTGWLVEKLGYRKRFSRVGVKLYSTSPQLLDFLRNSPHIYGLFDEDHNWQVEEKRRLNEKHRLFTYNRLWRSAHLAGAVSYIICITAAIVINDAAEQKVAWLTGLCFLFFCFLGWLSGAYVPLFACLKGYICLWNPFLSEPHFMLKLKQACDEFLRTREGDGGGGGGGGGGGLGRSECSVVGNGKGGKGGKGRSKSPAPPLNLTLLEDRPVDLLASAEADRALDNTLLKLARSHPKRYLKIVGHLLVFSELIALLTPAIAMGLQWITSLCTGPPVIVMMELLLSVLACFARGDWVLATLSSDGMPHCIIRQS